MSASKFHWSHAVLENDNTCLFCGSQEYGVLTKSCTDGPYFYTLSPDSTSPFDCTVSLCFTGTKDENASETFRAVMRRFIQGVLDGSINRHGDVPSAVEAAQ